MVLLGRLLLAAALLGAAGSTLWSYPHQLAYFNELAGGPHEGWRHLLGSSFDWGQDLLEVRDELQDHYGPTVVALSSSYPPSLIGDCLVPLHSLERGSLPRGSIFAVGTVYLIGRPPPFAVSNGSVDAAPYFESIEFSELIPARGIGRLTRCYSVP